MKFKLEFQLKENRLPIDHVRCFVSFFKKSLQSVDETIYQELYESNTSQMKPYTFSLYLPQRQVVDGELHLGGTTLHLTFSCSDLPLAINFLNGFTEQKNEIFRLPNENEMTLVRFTTEMHPVLTESTMRVRFLSPLLVLKRDVENRKNYYLTWDHEDFTAQLMTNLKWQLEAFDMDVTLAETFTLTPIQPKRVGQRVFGQLVLGNLGLYQMSGDPKLLQFLMEAGLGSRRSAGFGLFEPISINE